MAMAIEKSATPGDDGPTGHIEQQPNTQDTPSNELAERSPINGGFEGWLSVVAGFCVFVNSWCVDIWLSILSMLIRPGV